LNGKNNFIIVTIFIILKNAVFHTLLWFFCFNPLVGGIKIPSYTNFADIFLFLEHLPLAGITSFALIALVDGCAVHFHVNSIPLRNHNKKFS